jgi:hypothetical protein
VFVKAGLVRHLGVEGVCVWGRVSLLEGCDEGDCEILEGLCVVGMIWFYSFFEIWEMDFEKV